MKGTQTGKTGLLLMIVVMLTLIAASGCSTDGTVYGDRQVQASLDNQVQSFSTIYELDQIFTVSPMKVGLVNVGIVTNSIYNEGDNVQRGHLALGLEVANTSQETVWFYPEQIQVVLASGEELAADISISSDIGGNFPTKRIKKGFILFPINETVPEVIEGFTLKISAPLDENHQPLGEDQELVVTLK